MPLSGAEGDGSSLLSQLQSTSGVEVEEPL